MNTPRYLPDVLEAMKLEAPQEAKHFRFDMEMLIESAKYKAPEQMLPVWHQVAELLGVHFPRPEKLEDWQRKVVNIFMDKV